VYFASPSWKSRAVSVSSVNSTTNYDVRKKGVAPRIVEYTFSGFYVKLPMIEHTVVKFEMGYQLHDFFASVKPAPALAPLKCAGGVLSLYIVAAFRHPLEDTVGEGVSENLSSTWRVYV
jgi:hypothetical protein